MFLGGLGWGSFKMSVQQFRGSLDGKQVGKNDKKWFPLWVRRYASSVDATAEKLPVTEADVIRFSRSLRDSGTPAWQRLQAVRAVEAYRNLVLQTEEPSLTEMRRTLGRLAAQEKAIGTDCLGIQNERHLIGQINPRETRIVQQMRKELRLRHMAMRRTEGDTQRRERQKGTPNFQHFTKFRETG
jgi:hypothetical protein